jgi:short-subunit dehydrogenase
MASSNREPSLGGAHVLVTGAASGIGRQVATDLAIREGCRVRLLDLDADGLRTLAAELAARAGADAVLSCHTVDVGDGEAVAGLAAALAGTRLDVLINVAGIVSLGPFERTRLADLEHVVNVDLLGPLRVTRALLPLLLASDRASVVNVASAAGLVGLPDLAAYSAAKFGLVGLSQALRIELHGRVSVSAVCPTLVWTPLMDHARLAEEPGPPVDRRSAAREVLRRRGTSPAAVSRAVLEAIVARRGLVMVNADAHLLHHLHRLLPGLTEAVVRHGHHWLQRQGVLSR